MDFNQVKGQTIRSLDAGSAPGMDRNGTGKQYLAPVAAVLITFDRLADLLVGKPWCYASDEYLSYFSFAYIFLQFFNPLEENEIFLSFYIFCLKSIGLETRHGCRLSWNLNKLHYWNDFFFCVNIFAAGRFATRARNSLQ